jgi:hypothetical protein
MELLLNLLWLTLVLPAVLIWRRQSVCSRRPGCDRSFRAIVLLGCLLVLLFPIVSATDDLHPIRSEMEESNPSKRAVKQVSVPQAPDWGHFGSPPAHLVEVISFPPQHEEAALVPEYPTVLSEQFLAGTCGCRAPPSS